jgi:hypothetical protein
MRLIMFLFLYSSLLRGEERVVMGGELVVVWGRSDEKSGVGEAERLSPFSGGHRGHASAQKTQPSSDDEGDHGFIPCR